MGKQPTHRLKHLGIPGTAAILSLILACGGGKSGDATPDGGQGSVTVTLGILPNGESLGWMAYQDGDGTWKGLTSSDGKTATFQVTNGQGRYGVAIGTLQQPSGQPPVYSTRIWQATRKELSSLTYGDTNALPIGGVVSGAVNGVPAGEQGNVYLKGGATNLNAGSFDGILVTKGMNDLFIKTFVDPNSPTRYFIQRSLSIQGDTTLPPVDLTVSGAAPAQVPMTVAGLNGETALFSLRYQSPNGAYPLLHFGSTQGSLLGLVLPPHLRDAQDLYELRASVQGSQAGAYLYTNLSEGTPRVTLPSAVVSGPQASLVPNPTRGRLQWNGVAGTTYYNLFASQTQAGAQVECNATVTADWLGGTGALQYTQPDLSVLPGFSAYWLFTTAVSVDLQVVSWTFSDSYVFGKSGSPEKPGNTIQYSYVKATTGTLPVQPGPPRTAERATRIEPREPLGTRIVH